MMSEETLKKVVGWSIIVGLGANLLLALNLYRQMGDLEYKVHSLDGSMNSAIQSLSRDVWEMKSNQ
jgi:hypothetical protein